MSDHEIEINQGDTYKITAADAARAETPLTFTEAQIRELVEIAGGLDQFDGSMAAQLALAAQQNTAAEWADQDPVKCAAGGCIAGARHLERTTYRMLSGHAYSASDSFSRIYPDYIHTGLITSKDGVWNWQADETKLYGYLPWDLNSTIINHYNESIRPNLLDGMQYREFRRDEPYEYDRLIVDAMRLRMPSVICFRDGPNGDGGTHTSVAVLYRDTTGEYRHVGLDTAHSEWRGTLVMISEEEREEALQSPDPFVRELAAGPVRFGSGPRWLFNCYSHVIALSVMMRAFAGAV